MTAPLLVTTAYSFHFGTAPVRELARRARGLGFEALAISDRNSVCGAPAFIEACDAEGLRPMLGAELLYGSPGDEGRALLLARDEAGFSRLSRLLSAQAAGSFDARAELLRDSGGLAVATDDRALLACEGARDFYALFSPCNRRLWRGLSSRRPLATGEVRFLDGGDRALQRLLVAIGAGKTVPEVRDGEVSGADAVLVSPEGFESQYSDVPDALEENRRLVGRIGFRSLFRGFVFPRHGHEPGPSSAELLLRLVQEGAEARYGTPLGDAVRARIDHEMAVIEEKGFADYFLVVRDIVRKASRSCGRGSAAASIVSYSLGITDVDPIRHGLYFERFLNPGRVDPPDIDVDFAWDERDALLESVVRGYGEARAARVSNHVCFQARSALREAARAYGLPEGEIADFERAFRMDPAKALESADGDWKAVASLAPRLVGLPRHLGVHSGGVVLVPDDIAGRVPVTRTGSGIRVTAWDKEGVEAAGLVKIDLLGNRSLAVVRDALSNLAENGEGIDEPSWRPIDDKPTMDMLARGDTMGVFYVESPAMRLLQVKTGRGDFEHLVIHSSIIRPAANRYINEYIDRLDGKRYEPLHPLLAGILDESFGIMCYQEDVCKVAVALAGFTPAEADRIRKILSKKDVTERLAALKEKFRAGARARGVDEDTIREVWAMMESFSGYSFVKAHSASYAMLSFRSAYLRRHHPAEFMAAVMSNRGGYYSTLAYVSEARRMGLRVDPPDVNDSGLRCRARDGAIRFGLSMIGVLCAATAGRIVDERRRGGPYASVDDFARRVRPGRDDAEALVGSGALDSLPGGMRRARKLMVLLSIVAAGEEGRDGAPELFDPVTPTERESGGRDASARSVLENEMRFLGTTLSRHPLELYPKALAARRYLARDLPRLVGRRVTLIGWPITAKPVVTAKDEPMEFVSFEDETALYEAVLFPREYARFRHLLYEERPLLLKGLVEEDRGAVTLTVESLEPA